MRNKDKKEREREDGEEEVEEKGEGEEEEEEEEKGGVGKRDIIENHLRSLIKLRLGEKKRKNPTKRILSFPFCRENIPRNRSLIRYGGKQNSPGTGKNKRKLICFWIGGKA